MVRQLFAAGILQSAFWHQFAMTAHSPVGLDPAKFGVVAETSAIGTFANNDLVHQDPTGAEHDTFSHGLKKSLLNFMHGACLDFPLHKWFDFKVPKTSVPQDYILKALDSDEYVPSKPTAKVVWLGGIPQYEVITKSKKGAQWEVASITFESKKETTNIKVPPEQGAWLVRMLPLLAASHLKQWSLHEVMESYAAAGLEDFELFWDNKPLTGLHRAGLLVL